MNERHVSIDELPRWQGVRASLLVGVNYHRMLLEAMESFLESQAATGSS